MNLLYNYGLISLVMSVLMSFMAGAAFTLAFINYVRDYRVVLYITSLALLTLSLALGKHGMWIYMWVVFEGIKHA